MSDCSRRALLKTAAALALASAISDHRLSAAEPATGVGPKFKLGLVTYMVAADWDLPTVIRICKAAGVGGVELRTTHKHGVEPSLTKEQRSDVRNRFADSGVQLWGLGSVCEFQSADPSVVAKNVETCKQFLQLAHDAGARGVKVRPNGLPKDVPVDKTLAQIGKALAECGDAAKSLGLEVWAEVHGGGTQDPPNMKTIMETANHPSVGVTWNSNDGEVKNGSLAESFTLLKPWIRSCHINDLEKDAKGVYPYHELFKLLNDAGYDRYTLCEYAKSFPPEPGEAFLRQYKAQWTKLATS
jgi:sugar phosphate isomerase/epimerase